MSASSQITDQLTAHQKVPEKSGMWGFLLPKSGEKQVMHEPDSRGELNEINPAYMRLESLERLSDRGAYFVIGLCIAVISAVTFLPMYVGLFLGEFARPTAPLEWFGFSAILFLFTFGPLVLAYKCARSPLPSPMIISRRTRKVYAWENKHKKWVAMNYDTVVPAIYRHRLFNMGGSHTIYRLALCQLKPDSRDIEWYLGLGMVGSSPEESGALWEFIRRYMDGPPEALPPSRLLPRTDHPQSWMALADRTFFQSCIDSEHRVIRTAWGSAAWFFGMVMYWGERAAGWIRRTAPRHPYSDEVRQAMHWEGENPYPVLPPTEIDRLAWEGKLPHMRRRWFICGVASTLIFGFLFASVPIRAYQDKDKPPEYKCIGQGCDALFGRNE